MVLQECKQLILKFEAFLISDQMLHSYVTDFNVLHYPHIRGSFRVIQKVLHFLSYNFVFVSINPRQPKGGGAGGYHPPVKLFSAA